MLPTLHPDASSPAVVVTSVGAAKETITAITPGARANVIVKVITPLTVILIRALRAFLQTLLGGIMGGSALGLAGIPVPGIPFPDFWTTVQVSASIAASAALVSIIQNMIELLAKLDQSAPTWTA